MRLDRSRPEPLGAQLQHELREAIRAGRLAVGERLPSSRVLARELGVSRGLVLESYAQLTAEGFLSARGGSATRVAGGAHEPPAPATSIGQPERLEIDFVPGRPDLQSFPRRDWLWALRDAARTAPDSAFGYGDPQGTQRLREVLAGYLRRVRGAQADPGRIVICAGFAQGQNLVMRALARTGAREIANEDPGDPDFAGDAARWGLGAIPVPIDERGIDVRGPRGLRRPGRPAHPGPPVPDRCGAGARAPPGPGRLGQPERRHHPRGRLRRRVPVRPRPGRAAPGARPRPRRRHRHGLEGARAGASDRLDRVPAAARSTRSSRRRRSTTAARRRSTSSRSPG